MKAENSGNKCRKKTMPSEMQRFCFPNLFNGLSASQLEALRLLFERTGGECPGRRHLADFSRSIGLSQPKVKKWLEEEGLRRRRKSKGDENVVNIPSLGSDYDFECSNSSSSSLKDIDEEITKWDAILLKKIMSLEEFLVLLQKELDQSVEIIRINQKYTSELVNRGYC